MPPQSLHHKSGVLIVGSGPAGLVAALVLLKNGIPVRIIEKDSKHHNALRGSGIQPRTLELEHFMGVHEVRDVGMEFKMVLNIMDPADPHRVARQQTFFEKLETTPSMPITFPTMLAQFQHQAILRKHIESFGASVELGTELVAFQETDEGVQATLRKSLDGSVSNETYVSDYIIGADGARSIVRKSLGVEFIGHLEEDMSRYLVDALIDGLDQPGVTMFGKPGEDTVNFIRSAIPGVYQVIFGNSQQKYDMFVANNDNKDRIEQEIARISQRDDIHVLEVRSEALWRANVRMASSFRKGRAFIVGDAAHTHSPTGGQGLNTSIQDSYNLAWKMALVLKGVSRADILESYVNERMPVVAQMLNVTTALLKKETAEASDVIRGSQKAGGGPMRGRELLQLNVNYRWSDIVYDERFASESAEKNAYGVEGQAVRAGDRAPDAPSLECLFVRDDLTRVSRLFDLFNPTQHVALVFVDNPHSTTETLLSAMSKFPEGLLLKAAVIPAEATFEPYIMPEVDYVFRDTKGHAHQVYGFDDTASSAAVVIIRPDGHVGAFATSFAGIEKYTSLMFQ